MHLTDICQGSFCTTQVLTLGALYSPRAVYCLPRDGGHVSEVQAATFIHTVWLCSLLQTYWQAVVADINKVGELQLDMDLLVFLLGITDNLATTKHTKLFVFYALPMLGRLF